MSSDEPVGAARFPSTAWGCIRLVQDHDHPDHQAALDQFVRTYWRPVFYFLRARGRPLHEAEDLTQDFFLKLLQCDWLDRAEPGRGRFRNFLLAILVRFLADQGPGRAPRQQVFERQIVSIQALAGPDDRAFEPPAGATPEGLFMQKWAAAVMATVQEQLRRLYAGTDRQVWYELFAAARREGEAGKAPGQEALARRFGLTRDQVRYALNQVAKRFRRLLLAEVRDQVATEEEIQEEVQDLLRLLRG
jgi:RNA polymerase sigma-70 factor (ECF subfamily)